MRDSLFLLFFIPLFLIINPILAEELPYQKIQRTIEEKNYLSALKLANQLPEEEKVYLSGILEEKLGNYKQAIEFFQKYQKQSKLLSDYCFFHIANNYYSLGNFPEAILHYQKAESYFSKKSRYGHRILQRLAESYMKTDSFEKAIRIYQKLGNNEALKQLKSLQKYLSPEEKSSLVAKLRYLRGKNLFYSGNYQGALKEFNQIYPQNKEIFYWKGCALQKLKKYAEAISEYEKVNNNEGFWQMARCYAKSKNYLKATEILEKILRSFPNKEIQARAVYFLAKYCEELGKAEKAKTAYNRLKKLPYSFYSYCAARQGQSKLCHYNGPAGLMNQAPTINLSELEKNPEFNRALFLLKLGIKEEAREELKNLARKGYGKGKIFTFLHLYQEANAYAQIINLGLILKNKKLVYPLYYQKIVEKYSKMYNLDRLLVFAIIWQESKFEKEDISSASAIGLMQIIPSTGKDIAVGMRKRNYKTATLFVPETNIMFGCYYFRYLLNNFDNDVILALCAYNGGPGNTRRWIAANWSSWENEPAEFVEDIPFVETYNYVKKIISAYQEYQELYKND